MGRKEICNDGWYGENCFARCNENCVNQSCDHITGSCTYGCKPGWRTPNCEQKCSVGTYGKDCGNHRSGHCRNMTCNSITGSCLEGCTPGYLGSFCNKPCDKGTYGINCSKNCSQNCLGFCDNVGGYCTCSSRWMESPGCSEKAPIISNDEHSIPDAYIAALSFSLIINFSLVVVIVILLRLLYNRKQEKRSSDYITSADISPPSPPSSQVSDNDVHHYQELNMPNDSSYQNLSLRDRS
ncbi:multiple epidermal growth factor-like domains protein 10 [Ostrea edulis]|uniref:multiple epidermal growth factor-like domains protein 10 n=1 Tax=Ostrea edulis TaxID=37623 RepID=UPI0024AECBAB|nr:multiple epidermal growth factor-like domains protein 10 [Ostrea edulis]